MIIIIRIVLKIIKKKYTKIIKINKINKIIKIIKRVYRLLLITHTEDYNLKRIPNKQNLKKNNNNT